MRISDWSSDVCSSDLLVVATVSDLEGRDVSDYGYRLGREWQNGDKEKDAGVVFLIAPNERRMSIAGGYGTEPILPHALLGRTLRAVGTPTTTGGHQPGGQKDSRQRVGREE